jgi:hypothetical protein
MMMTAAAPTALKAEETPRPRWRLRRLGVLALALACLLALPITRVIHERWEYRRVNALLRSPEWDWNLPAVANWANHRKRLMAHAPLIVRVLRRDLNYEPATEGRLNALPEWLVEPLASLRPRASSIVRADAAHALRQLGAAGREALPDLIGRAADPDERVRSEVALTLGAVGEDSPGVRGALTAILTNRGGFCVTAAAFSLWRLQPADTNALQRLLPIDPRMLPGLSSELVPMGKSADLLFPAFRDAMERMTHFDSQLNAVKSYWQASQDSEPAVALTHRVIDAIRAPPANPFDSTTHGRALNHLASTVTVLGELTEVQPLFHSMLRDIEAQPGEEGTFRHVREELEKIERWQKAKREKLQ